MSPRFSSGAREELPFPSYAGAMRDLLSLAASVAGISCIRVGAGSAQT